DRPHEDIGLYLDNGLLRDDSTSIGDVLRGKERLEVRAISDGKRVVNQPMRAKRAIATIKRKQLEDMKRTIADMKQLSLSTINVAQQTDGSQNKVLDNIGHKDDRKDQFIDEQWLVIPSQQLSPHLFPFPDSIIIDDTSDVESIDTTPTADNIWATKRAVVKKNLKERPTDPKDTNTGGYIDPRATKPLVPTDHPLIPIDRGPYRCCYCGKMFDTIPVLDKHHDIHF
ncbi:unnamed protein product, partial [Medioppia subpectinata]